MDFQSKVKSGSKKNYNQQIIFRSNKRPQSLHVHQNSVGNFLADKNEFPSLSEISEPDISSKNSLYSPKTPHTYSEKLKISCQKEKQLASNAQLFNYGSNLNNPAIKDKELHLDSRENVCDKQSSNNYLRVSSSNGKLKNKIHCNTASPNHKLNISCQKTSKFTSDVICQKNAIPSNTNNPSNNITKSKIKSNNEEHRNLENNKQCGEFESEQSTKTRKKKKRKSKAKRQIALQSGKIMVLTPEAHSKILNQSCSQNPQLSKSIVTDINDDEEYPELGKSPAPKSFDNKVATRAEIDLKKSEISKSPEEKDDKNFISKTNGDSSSFSGELMQEYVQCNLIEEKISINDKEAKSDAKITVHKKDPITVSFFDILSTSKAKIKEPKEKVELRSITTPDKSKKGHHHNILDSSPAIKRGKERENPRTKKPSHLKKIILLDRKARKERFNQCLNNSLEKNEAENGIDHSLEKKEAENDVTFKMSKNENQMAEVSSSTKLPLFHNEFYVQESINEELSLLNLNSFKKEMQNKNLISTDCIMPKDNVVPDINVFCTAEENYDLLKLETYENERLAAKFYESHDLKTCNISVSFDEDDLELCALENSRCPETLIEAETLDENNSLLQPLEISSENSENKLNIELSLANEFEEFGITKSVHNTDFAPNSALTEAQNFSSPEKEKLQAAKIVIHTRNFREYCTHLTSKDIDDTVFALLDDLARFQDRMHQKDPVKARMKRRLIYGIKEVKKHVTLKKLKCIIIASDIENVQTEGGLNDVLSDIKSSADDHHIPCVFALTRKRLGKVCHKPVPVSCVGVFNYDGSEGNFKKMIELQKQSAKDYAEILNNLVEKLSDDSVMQLLKVRKESPDTLHSLRTEILREFLILEKKPNENAVPNCEE